MSDNPQKDEAELIKAAAPLINQMGMDLAAERDVLNKAVKAQLRFVYEGIQDYVPMQPRGWGDDNQMPHEWGSMGTYDDMRNSLRFCALLMDNLIDPFSPQVEDQQEQLRQIIIESESGLCALDPEVEELAGTDGDDGFDVLERTARQMEKDRGLEHNSLFPTSEEE